MEHVETVFTALLECGAQQRGDRLDSLCADNLALREEVGALLSAADKAKGFLSVGPLATAWPSDAALDSNAILGQQIDSWRIIRELDSGGMGIVFLAERIDGHYQQQVAIKLARFGLTSSATVNRFHSERQILANLHHPNIAQLLDGGTGPDGHPYLVMEFVKGDAIDKWCESQQLSIEQVLRLMITVCDAVDYAHRNLVVHCDLKPSNILVSDGIPKLLDFGIATLMKPVSTPEEASCSVEQDASTPMTPTFAAPEQIRGESVTTVTDIYALGVLLYRLLSGAYPYSIDNTNCTELARLIATVEVLPPSSKAVVENKRKLQGDLDRIILRALHKDPQQRYASIQELSTDIRQFLAGYPVSVSPVSWCYRLCKFTQRNKWSVALGAVAVISLWVGSFFSFWQWQVATDKQNLAEQRFADVRGMINSLVDELPKSIALQPGSTQMRVQLLDQGIENLDDLVKTQTNNLELIRELAIAYEQLGRLQGFPGNVNLGEPAKAAASFEKSLALQFKLLEHYPNDIDLAIEMANTLRSSSATHFLALSNPHLSYEYADKCQELLRPWAPTGNPRVLHRLLSCYTFEARYRSIDQQFEKAKQALIAAEELYTENKSNHVFLNSYRGHQQRTRLHEEWAEVEARTGSKEQALNHERKRLDIILTYMQGDVDVAHIMRIVPG